MKNNSITSILSIFLILFGSCNGKRVEDSSSAKILKLTGINGTANYYISRSQGKVVTVLKDEYTRIGEYIIQIDKDTVLMGDKFIANLYVFKPKFKISIEEPRKEVMEGRFKEAGSETKTFVFTAETLGTFRWKGQLEYDSVVVPFEYRFIVTPSGPESSQ